MFRFLMSSLKTLTPAYGHLRTSKESRTFANALDPKSRFLGPSIMVKWAATIRVLEMSTMTKNPVQVSCTANTQETLIWNDTLKADLVQPGRQTSTSKAQKSRPGGRRAAQVSF